MRKTYATMGFLIFILAEILLKIEAKRATPDSRHQLPGPSRSSARLESPKSVGKPRVPPEYSSSHTSHRRGTWRERGVACALWPTLKTTSGTRLNTPPCFIASFVTGAAWSNALLSQLTRLQMMGGSKFESWSSVMRCSDKEMNNLIPSGSEVSSLNSRAILNESSNTSSLNAEYCFRVS
uniref:(California timema) hypothetical protein n=1 Tax=Timema californicum TaxID=61474 RepID=A0A7R9J0Q9_TIMCA|nr:unnamed protein product [Timema californicum]